LQWLVSGGWGSDEFSSTSVSPGASCVAIRICTVWMSKFGEEFVCFVGRASG
jgi:hypothetical protein